MARLSAFKTPDNNLQKKSERLIFFKRNYSNLIWRYSTKCLQLYAQEPQLMKLMPTW